MIEETSSPPDLLALLDELIKGDEQDIAGLTTEIAIDFLLIQSAIYAPYPTPTDRAGVAGERMEDNVTELKYLRRRVKALYKFKDELGRNPMYAQALAGLLGFPPK